MKKITKLWLLTLGLAGCLVALNASADTGDNKEVSLTLNAWNNSCTIESYAFWEHSASPDDINLTEIEHPITCLFLENATGTVTLALADLSDGGANSIDNDNFSFAVAAAGKTWQIAELGATNASFADTTTIYVKDVNKLWSWASTLTISWTVPGWTPSWTYTGALNLLITNS